MSLACLATARWWDERNVLNENGAIMKSDLTGLGDL